ncbi:hypothetical protein RDWZM_002318 [Blomia tropicalis]|uniref:Serrate RNA effector molecule homolog n=1 Tax=Blomia tropicalis TaxID=40697 RepID=A0A9Q0MCJ6_BLOTA|nr:hypothetical protein RDWZM_002318 [Blomia tropicalis]
MGDSDDEYDRRGRGRDKFRRERNDYQDRPPTNQRRDDWLDSGNSIAGGPSGGHGIGGNSGMGSGWTTSGNMNRDRGGPMGGGGRDYGVLRDRYGMPRNYGSGRNDRYSPGDRSGDMSPPTKRIRSRDWDERYGGPNYELGGGHHSQHGDNRGGSGGNHRSDNFSQDRDADEQYQPPMQTLKQFLHYQDDHIDEDTLISKYNEYKCEFRRTQIQEFFNRHKDEEWFRSKYFPDEIDKRKERQAEANQRRLEVFMELLDNQYFDGVSLDVDKADQIVRVLDAVVIKLEGGTDFDMTSLDLENLEAASKSKDSSIFTVDSSSTSKATGVIVQPKVIPIEDDIPKGDNEDQPMTPMAESEDKVEDSLNEQQESKAIDSGMEDESGEVKDQQQESDAIKDMDLSGDVVSPDKPQTADADSGDGELIEEGEEVTESIKSPKDSKEEFSENGEASKPLKPRALHKTCSIFFRNLAPSITRQEIEDECKKFPGFLRLALSEPQMDRKFNRRGWATYERTVNIREICWALNSIKIRGTEIGPIVNRDLTRRIRSVNGISSHKSVVRADIRHAAKLIMKLDSEKGFWKEEQEESLANSESKNGNSIAVPSRNPLLKNITDYLIEEASAEEEELLGTAIDVDPIIEPKPDAAEGEANGNGSTTGLPEGSLLERDEELISVLDRLLFYLRIVHSTDYYSHAEYPSEDEMPNRIGLIHARGLISSSRVTANEITDYLKDMETKISPLLLVTPVVTPEEARKLGLKNIDDAIEQFIKENTKELGEGKWLCPLSNKKFMGPEFVRKHIMNKHSERVEQVRAETHYFNNYILDPKRPQLPENPLNQQRTTPVTSRLDHRIDMHGGIMSGAYGGAHGGGFGGHMRAPYGPGGRYQLYPQEHFGRGMKRNRNDNYQQQAPLPHPPSHHSNALLPNPIIGGSGGSIGTNRPNLRGSGRDSVEYDDVAFEELI